MPSRPKLCDDWVGEFRQRQTSGEQRLLGAILQAAVQDIARGHREALEWAADLEENCWGSLVYVCDHLGLDAEVESERCQAMAPVSLWRRPALDVRGSRSRRIGLIF